MKNTELFNWKEYHNDILIGGESDVNKSDTYKTPSQIYYAENRERLKTKKLDAYHLKKKTSKRRKIDPNKIGFSVKSKDNETSELYLNGLYLGDIKSKTA